MHTHIFLSALKPHDAIHGTQALGGKQARFWVTTQPCSCVASSFSVFSALKCASVYRPYETPMDRNQITDVKKPLCTQHCLHAPPPRNKLHSPWSSAQYYEDRRSSMIICCSINWFLKLIMHPPGELCLLSFQIAWKEMSICHLLYQLYDLGSCVGTD